MSFDIFVLDLPRDVRTVEDIPPEFLPGPLGSRSKVLDAVRSVFPLVSLDSSGWATIEGPEYSVELNLGVEDPVESFALHIHGDSQEALFVVAEILNVLDVRALAPGTASGFFSLDEDGVAAFERWRRFRDGIGGQENPQ